jgi:hypothetical protein
MVVGEQFAWGHLAKTAGDATLGLFRLFPELIEFADEATEPLKHARFSQRPELVAGKLLVLNIRRLPLWVLSYATDQTVNGRTPPWSAEQMADTMIPDQKLSSWLGDGIHIDRWIRVEHLASDFLALVTELGPVTTTRRMRVQARARRRVNARRYDHDISRWLSSDQIARLYRQNPLWASVERSVYADTGRAERA